MQQWKSLRHQRRIKETIAARISAVMLIAAVLLMTHYTYKKAYAGEAEEEDHARVAEHGPAYAGHSVLLHMDAFLQHEEQHESGRTNQANDSR